MDNAARSPSSSPKGCNPSAQGNALGTRPRKGLNPQAPPEAIDAAVNGLTRDRSVMSLAAANREVYALLKQLTRHREHYAQLGGNSNTICG
jgi:hypothetical protein